MKAKGKEGILIHLIKESVRPVKWWLTDEADLLSLNISTSLQEELRSFWRNRNELFFSGKGSDGENRLVVIAERLIERRSLMVFGAGHVGYSVAIMGAMIGLKVVLLDDREDFLRRAGLADSTIETLLIEFSKINRDISISRNSAVVIVTRGHQSDEEILRQIADFDPDYVGMIGSRRRVEGVFRRLRGQGVSDSFLRRVKAPIGLDIGARTPQEIAVSVHAEIIKHFSSANSGVGGEVQ